MLRYQFRPSALGFIVVLCCVAVFCKLGLWQYNKAQQKILYQTQLDSHLNGVAVNLPDSLSDIESWRYRLVKFSGEYDQAHQFLLDNQVRNGVAGYNVITPVRIEGSNITILVNRGWIAANPIHSDIPSVETPSGMISFEGNIWIPSSKYFTLETHEANSKPQISWQRIWQNMDIKAYAKLTGQVVLPYAIKLSPNVNAGGFERDWVRPDDRVTTHLGYAYQWFGFAAAAVLIYLYTCFKKKVV